MLAEIDPGTSSKQVFSIRPEPILIQYFPLGKVWRQFLIQIKLFFLKFSKIYCASQEQESVGWE